jgi:threonine synthase
LIKKTGGYAWRASNANIRTAQEITKKYTGLDISTNSALSVVGIMKANAAGHKTGGAGVCLICGE